MAVQPREENREGISNKTVLKFVVLLGVVSLFADKALGSRAYR